MNWKTAIQFNTHFSIFSISPQTLKCEIYYFHISISSCSSLVGRQKNWQPLSLADGCLIQGTIIHELLHALGFFHEQSRLDRDNFVTIVWDNVQKGIYLP